MAELKCLSFFKIIQKPLYLSRVINILKEEIKHLMEFKASRLVKRVINLPVDIMADKITLHCQTDSLSLKGALITADANQDPDSNLFRSFFGKKKGDVLISLQIKEEQKIEVPSRLVFTEKTPQDLIKNAGLLFTKLPAFEQQQLEALITAAA